MTALSDHPALGVAGQDASPPGVCTYPRQKRRTVPIGGARAWVARPNRLRAASIAAFESWVKTISVLRPLGPSGRNSARRYETEAAAKCRPCLVNSDTRAGLSLAVEFGKNR